MSSSLIIIVPVYKEIDIDSEWQSFNNLVKTVNCHYEICFVAPEKMRHYLEFFCHKYNIGIRVFEDSFFAGIEGYNRLMLSSKFYDEFLDYDYVLIHQLDCWLFDGNMSPWLSREFDYIGAPWEDVNLYGYWSRKLSVKRIASNLIGAVKYSQVGNGGLSLRKVLTFSRVLKSCNAAVEFWNFRRLNEDLFWSYFVTSNDKKFHVPSAEVARYFAIEDPKSMDFLPPNTLPLGLHGWSKQEFIHFWCPRFIPCRPA